MAGRRTVSLPHSSIKENLAKILLAEGYLKNLEVVENKAKKEILLTLIADGNKTRLIEVKRISKLGRRVYARAKELKTLNRGLGIIIVSTPLGLMTSRKAFTANLGGEVLCKVIL